jgi:uncharacterized protein (TIGR02145 family)
MRTLFLLFFVGIKSIYFSQTTITDVSGNIYKTVKIGNQIWMAENLRTEKFRNGDPIEQITSNRFWQDISVFAMNDTTLEEIYPAMCFYDNVKQKNNALYNYYTVIDDRGVCPSGWHIPSVQEYEDLIEYLGGYDKANSKLKSTSSWKVNGTNSSGFNALAIGIRVGSGDFSYKTEETEFWTDDIYVEEYGDIYEFHGMGLLINSDKNSTIENSTREFGIGNFTMGMAASIRCIKN